MSSLSFWLVVSTEYAPIEDTSTMKRHWAQTTRRNMLRNPEGWEIL
ncbi:hypothetical protein [Halocynthiibacter sp.]